MKWVTRKYLHFDRMATPWLIKRFIDVDAEFYFVDWGHEDERPEDAIPFSIPGTEIGPHDEHGSTFRKTMVKYEVDDPVLQKIASIVDAGIDYYIHGNLPSPDDKLRQIAVGLLEISEGMLVIPGGDTENMSSSFPMWDALYRSLKVEHLMHERKLSTPHHGGRGPVPKIEFMRALLGMEA